MAFHVIIKNEYILMIDCSLIQIIATICAGVISGKVDLVIQKFLLYEKFMFTELLGIILCNNPREKCQSRPKTE